MPPKPIVIDACSALNLLATERAVNILQAMDWMLLVLPEVKQEAQYHQGPPDEEGRPTRIAVEWSALERAARAAEKSSDSAGDVFLDEFIKTAAQLTDVDAAAAALAGALKLPLLSDDGKVRRVFGQLYPALELHSTLGLIRQASLRLGFDEKTLRDVLRTLRAKARFAPPKRDPERDWYVSYLMD